MRCARMSESVCTLSHCTAICQMYGLVKGNVKCHTMPYLFVDYHEVLAYKEMTC